MDWSFSKSAKIKSNQIKSFTMKYLKSCFVSAQIFAVLLVITTLAVIVPFSPQLPSEGLDSSWVLALNQAVGQGLIFGKDIVFTFGPYASIYTNSFHPATDGLMLWGAVYLSFAFALAIYLNFKQSSLILKCLILIILCSFNLSHDTLFFYYMLLVGVYLAKSNECIDIDNNQVKYQVNLVILFSAFGLLPLIKISMTMGCFAIIFMAIIISIQNRKFKNIAIILSSFIFSLIIFWLISGQPLFSLLSYMILTMPIVANYTEAMAVKGSSKEIILYLFAACILIWTILKQSKIIFFDKIIMAFMFCTILFLSFKAGFVRHDGHALISASMILIAALLLSTFTSGALSIISVFVAGFVWLYIDSAYSKTSTESVLRNSKLTYSVAWSGLVNRIIDKDKINREYVLRMQQLKIKAGLPSLKGTTDIYSYDQAFLIASNNTWNPRPTFQSYAAYGASLINGNNDHLLNINRPDNIFFKIQAIDGRLPSIEDGESWFTMLTNYHSTEFYNGFLLLKNNKNLTNKNNYSKKISKHIYEFNEEISIPISNDLVFAKININYSSLGSFFNLIYKPSQIQINLKMENNSIKTYRLIAGMTKTSFLISPLIENTEEFNLLYSDSKYLNEKKIKSITITSDGGGTHWGKEFELEFLAY